jgi:purine-nucleoside phosphorylase
VITDVKEYKEKVEQAASYIKEKSGFDSFDIGVILGSGLGGLVEAVENPMEIPYEEIPNFPRSTVKGHSGKLVIGKIGDKKVVMLSGRFHYYEGYPMEVVTFPVRVFGLLGIKLLVVTNAAGGMNPTFRTGDIMIIEDHISFLMPNPLIGPNIDEWGVRFPDVNHVYPEKFWKLAMRIADEMGIRLEKGVYVAVTGPTYETKAELKLLRGWGADAVGMSTVPEAIVAAHMKIPVLGFSVITDIAIPGFINELTHEEVLKVASEAGDKLVKIVEKVIKEVDL